MKFTFADFLVFAGTANVNEDTYSTIAKGVLNTLKSQFGLYPEIELISHDIYSESGQLSFTPPIHPICNVYRVWNDDEIIDDSTYSYYGEDVLFDVAIIDLRKPITFELNVGFENGVPDDLVLAMYRHILAVYYAIDKHTDNVDKVANASGNTTTFRDIDIPMGSKRTYEFYSGRTLLDF